jgi:hypothetical protein
MEDDGTFFGHLVHFRSFVIFWGQLVKLMVIWYIFPDLVFCTKKNLATLVTIQLCRPRRPGLELMFFLEGRVTRYFTYVKKSSILRFVVSTVQRCPWHLWRLFLFLHFCGLPIRTHSDDRELRQKYSTFMPYIYNALHM